VKNYDGVAGPVGVGFELTESLVVEIQVREAFTRIEGEVGDGGLRESGRRPAGKHR